MINKKTAKQMVKDCSYLTLKEIAIKYDVPTYQTIQRAFKKYGFNPKRSIERIHIYNLTKTESAYIAGIIDGEGYIKCSLIYGKVDVSNTSIELLEWLKSKLGGSICKKSIPKPTQHQAYTWQLSKIRAKGLLKLVSPYLIVKKETAIKFLNL